MIGLEKTPNLSTNQMPKLKLIMMWSRTFSRALSSLCVFIVIFVFGLIGHFDCFVYVFMTFNPKAIWSLNSIFFSYPELKPLQTLHAHPANCICIKFDPKGRWVKLHLEKNRIYKVGPGNVQHFVTTLYCEWKTKLSYR